MNDIRFQGYLLPTQFTCIKATGSDAQSFLHGQTTNDVKNIPEKSGALQTLIDIAGKIEGLFYLYKYSEDAFLIFVPSEIKEETLERLNKYLIIEEVEFNELEINVLTIIGEELIDRCLNINEDSVIRARFYGDNVAFVLDPDIISQTKPKILEQENLEKFRKLNGFPAVNEILGSSITSTRFSELSLALDKGCFLGQEVVAKIMNNRGAATYPSYFLSTSKIELGKHDFGVVIDCFKFQDKFFTWVDIKRELRVEGKNIEGNELHYMPFYDNEPKSKSIELYEIALELYSNEDKIEEAINKLELSLKLNPDNEDAYEILAVLVGRTGDNRRAIRLLEKLVKINPELIMAHTNLSYFYMQDGQVEKAEEEKAVAIGLQMNSSPQDDKKAQIEELKRRESMFKEVLEIDSEDVMALNGLGEICFERGELKKSIDFLNKVLELNPKYSVAYLTLGKALRDVSKKDEAKKVFEKGIDIAASLGEMKPANEMQALLNKL
jgi:tetratricopeptide (TPR) repeat protein